MFTIVKSSDSFIQVKSEDNSKDIHVRLDGATHYHRTDELNKDQSYLLIGDTQEIINLLSKKKVEIEKEKIVSFTWEFEYKDKFILNEDGTFEIHFFYMLNQTVDTMTFRSIEEAIEDLTAVRQIARNHFAVIR